jgi:hypothetical protein
MNCATEPTPERHASLFGELACLALALFDAAEAGEEADGAAAAEAIDQVEALAGQLRALRPGLRAQASSGIPGPEGPVQEVCECR